MEFGFFIYLNSSQDCILFMKNLFFVFIACVVSSLVSAKSGFKEIFREEFEDNSREWLAGNSSDYWSEVSEGKFFIQHKREKGSYMFVVPLKELDEKNDWEVEVKMRQMSGVYDYGYGVLYGFKDVDNTHAMTVSSNGYTCSYSFFGGKYKKYTDWIRTRNVKPIGEYNTLIVRKENGMVTLIVNGKVVAWDTVKEFFGDYVGFVLNRKMYAQVDHLIVRERKVEVARISSPESFDGSLSYQEEFKDNSRGWWDNDVAAAEAYVSNGKYHMNHKPVKNSYFFYKAAYLDPEDDFYLSTEMTQTSGVDNRGYGLAFGLKDADDSYAFTLSSNGFWMIYGFDKGNYFELVTWTKSAHIRGMNEPNELGIRKSSDGLHFYVNGNEVYQCSGLRFFSNSVGFVLNNQMEADAEYIRIKHEGYQFHQVAQKDESLKRVNLGSGVNSRFEELAPLISADGKTLWFTRDDHPSNIGGSGNDLWYSKLAQNGDWGRAVNPKAPLNNTGNNFVVSVSPDNNTMLVANEYLADGSEGGDGVSETYLGEDGWGIPKLVKVRNWYNDNDYVSYFLSSNNLTMVVSAERIDSEGDCDLYVCFRKKDGSFTAPRHMGSALNTLGNESTPFLAADNKTLYFSSDGLPGYGNNDVFVTKRLDDSWTKWSTPQNLGPLINGPAFDAYYSIPASGEEAYFVSYTNTIGESDIFKIEIEEEAKPDPVQLVKGVVRDDKTQEVIAAEITIRDLNSNKEVGVAHSNPSTGYYEIVLPKGGNYAFYARSKGFYAIREHVDLTELAEYQERNVDLHLAPIEIGENILLNNVFFVQSKAEIKKDSYSELDNLARVLKRNKSLKVLIEGHTHNVGSAYKNQVLSNERARALRNYLLKKGIKEDRMEVKGYGETKPIADNNDPVERLRNSRVEFKIIAY